MIAESYDWYLAHRAEILRGGDGKSRHQSAVRQRLLGLIPYVIR